MDRFLYFIARVAAGLLQALPMRWVAQVGRCGGEAVFWMDARHRRMAVKNLTRCFRAEKSAREIRALAHENFRRIGENYCCAVKTAAMDDAELRTVLEVKGAELLNRAKAEGSQRNGIFATGHFGNFELFGRLSGFVRGYRCAATYRGLRQPSLDRLLYKMRTVSGNLLFERRTGADDLKRAMNAGGMLLVLLSDQSARDDGLETPFFGQPCFTTRAPAVMANRYDCALFAPICYRTGPGRWVIEIGEPIPTRENEHRRSTEAITLDINTALESAIRRDPANWFWVHNRWKPRLVAARSESVAGELQHAS